MNIYISFLFFICIFSRNIHSQENNIYQQYLNVYDIPITIDFDDYNCFIDNTINTNDYRKFLDFVYSKILIIADNIVNVNTTRTANGGAFKRKSIEIVNGEVRIIEKGSESIYRYIPTHPDAIKSGHREGYVEFPNIDIISECVDFLKASRIYKEVLNEGMNIEVISKDNYEQLMIKVDELKTVLCDFVLEYLNK